MKDRYEIIKAALEKGWSRLPSLCEDGSAEYFAEGSLPDAEPLRQTLEEVIKQGREIDVSRVRMQVDTDASGSRHRLAAVLIREEEASVVTFHSFREVSFRNCSGLVRMRAQTMAKPVLVLAFPDGTAAINVRSPDDLHDRPLAFDRQINRLLQQSESFRTMFCELLTGSGEKILQDIAETVREDHCFMLPYSIDELRIFRDAQALAERFNWAGIRLDESLSMNQAYYLARIALFVQDADWDALEDYCRKSKTYYREKDLSEGGPDPVRFFAAYVLSKKPGKEPAEVLPLIEDYFNTCNNEDELASLTELEDL